MMMIIFVNVIKTIVLNVFDKIEKSINVIEVLVYQMDNVYMVHKQIELISYAYVLNVTMEVFVNITRNYLVLQLKLY